MILVTLFVVGWCYSRVTATHEGPQIVDAPPPARGPSDVELISMTETQLKGKLRDPGSAQLRNVRVRATSGTRVVCGEVNSKNGFGGYSGFQRYVGAGSAVFLESELKAGEFDAVWAKMC